MSEYRIQDTTLTGIADAIRSKTGVSAPIVVSEMADEIKSIPTVVEEVVFLLLVEFQMFQKDSI